MSGKITQEFLRRSLGLIESAGCLGWIVDDKSGIIVAWKGKCEMLVARLKKADDTASKTLTSRAQRAGMKVHIVSTYPDVFASIISITDGQKGWLT